MAERWYVIYEERSGRLRSLGSIDDTLAASSLRGVADADQLTRQGLTVLEIVDRPDLSAVMWSETARRFRPIVQRDRADDLLADPDGPVLTPEQQRALRFVLDRHWPLEARLYRP